MPLIAKVQQKPKPNMEFLQHEFDVKVQAKVSEQIARDIGFDFVCSSSSLFFFFLLFLSSLFFFLSVSYFSDEIRNAGDSMCPFIPSLPLLAPLPMFVSLPGTSLSLFLFYCTFSYSSFIFSYLLFFQKGTNQMIWRWD